MSDATRTSPRAGLQMRIITPECVHVWRFAHVLKRGIQRYRIYYCERCLVERERRL